ncbi:MAG: UDP-2,4-diacetamido-2,4,6-trideoxy-beta-L-altropyranose hydrolase [Clostridium beijerinckii]|jgi:UDP-2,4-diacetamido-2,4,6-trideoxy-beta-L-altropyranose hydrolase|uniref:UDP-2,4-diacetamido-2,4, 6-trideoxy-beta-L-altropyranose hydrolase n=1 Tax=Clostridium beijerinckii TaxID=1520 RepID=UPI001494A21A|nr:UDP-2,4-diacetamido-2,4,6-trideoxy-beta-L-altropyranose hydrolase [Clostridium beijerinckii]MCI1477711.1 UDP-2,4-diacetamido-2,4,6-trideoxy-beta-L-altropyranose hydrolase [Clostridium beijerinckii]MCI1577973.1 UDP-2,4-diacetamido-2,4,6-trideoxy-beta-L-altropyranose hydrolase [Clostridium beijerinckii]MCI1583695.1 UDP-2,4-diacetamido-2,4,6-trideoxy-beta-L-altropyranose hydrolase [Clostridium beijerinckii]MCI1620616.1 UDP-2,4-diacetamido-2,4,6-trideoxy-beta-L-altropyranose hydrolase [Clostridi
MKIFIRADGGNTIGLGHVMRMLVLAKELRKTNEVIFICRRSEKLSNERNNTDKSIHEFEMNKYEAGIEKIKEESFEIAYISEDTVVEDIINCQKEYKAELLITDSYDVNEDYFNILKPYFNSTGYVDDVNKCRMNVDFVINQNINAEDMHYIQNINKNTRLFLGTKYCMLRDEFSKVSTPKMVKEKCENLLLTLGGMDKDFNTLKILEVVNEINIKIDVVVGNAFPEKLIEDLYNMSEKNINIKIHENANMSKLMGECDVAIASCGSTLYELCAVNVPAIGIIIADNQLEVALKMKKMKLISGAYWVTELNSETISKNFKIQLINLINSKNSRVEMIQRQKEIVNVNGAEILTKEINMLYL